MSLPNGSGGIEPDRTPTRTKIVRCAATLFATKGYTETSIRELAAAAGLQGSAIYHHFASKSDILQYIFKDFADHSFGVFTKEEVMANISVNPTSDGILSSMLLAFPEGLEDYYSQVLCVLLQEQYRNPPVRAFIIELIRACERFVCVAVEVLKELNIVRQDTDPDYWMKIASSVEYAYSSRYALGISESYSGYTGMSMSDLLKTTFDLMLKTCAVAECSEQL